MTPYSNMTIFALEQERDKINAELATRYVVRGDRGVPPEGGATSDDTASLDFAESKAATIYCSEAGHWVFVDERKKERTGVIGANGIRSCIDNARGKAREPQSSVSK